MHKIPFSLKKKNKRKKVSERSYVLTLLKLISSSFSKTFPAVYRSASVRLEWNFTFFAALCTNRFVHLSAFSI